MGKYTVFMNQRLNIVKMASLHKFTYKFNAILIKIKESFPPKLNKLVQKIIWKHKRAKNKQGNTEEQQNWRTANRYQDLCP